MPVLEYLILQQGIFAKPGNTHIFQNGQVILPNGENLQLLQCVHMLNFRYPVTVETEVLQFGKSIQALNYFNIVEGQVWEEFRNQTLNYFWFCPSILDVGVYVQIFLRGGPHPTGKVQR